MAKATGVRKSSGKDQEGLSARKLPVTPFRAEPGRVGLGFDNRAGAVIGRAVGVGDDAVWLAGRFGAVG